MPPKPKFTREEIVRTALTLVSQKGTEALTAKELGCALGSSARPIFTVFRSMQEVQEAVRAAAMHRFEESFCRCAADMPLLKRVGMHLVLFGQREPKLYQLLFMRERREAVRMDDVLGPLGGTADLCIQSLRQDYGLRQEEARTLLETVWFYTFGIGALCATGACRFTEERLGEMLSSQLRALLPRRCSNA